MLEEVVRQGDTVMDATCGNGNDTFFLSQLVKEDGNVFAFDIQEKALENTSTLLSKNNIQNVKLIHDGHENCEKYIPTNDELAGAIFNLGYLPKGDHQIITTPQNTIRAIQSILTRLRPNGRIVIVVYHGHMGGKEEKEKVLDFCGNLDQSCYQVLQYQFINQINHPPFIIAIEKLC